MAKLVLVVVTIKNKPRLYRIVEDNHDTWESHVNQNNLLNSLGYYHKCYDDLELKKVDKHE